MRQDMPLDYNEVVIKPMDFMPACGMFYGLFISSQLERRTPSMETKENLDSKVIPLKPVLGLEMPTDKNTDQYLWPLQKQMDR